MPPPGPTSANPEALDAYVSAMSPADQDLNDASVGLAALVNSWNATPSGFGGRIDGAKVAAVDTATDELSYLDLWVGRVAEAFRDADRFCPSSGCGPVLLASEAQLDAAGPPSLAEAVAAGVYDHLFEVVRDGSDGQTRVVRLAFDDPPEGMSELEWQLLVEELGLTGDAGPLHVVMHGWGASTGGAVGAGEATADRYDQQGVEGATVLVVDWDAKQGTDAPLWEVAGDFGDAEASARDTGDAFAPVLTAIASANPDAVVGITAHSLGNHIAARALSQMDDPTGRFAVDYLMVQPAIGASAATDDPNHYGALTGPRVRDLTVTINNGDNALFWYELRGDAALGDEASDGGGLTALIERREAAGLTTGVVDHDSSAGGGHLGLAPDGSQGLVLSLTHEMIDRLSTGEPSPQTAARIHLYTERGDLADVIIASPEMRAYLDAQQAAGEPPSLAEIDRIAEELFPTPITPTGTTTTTTPPPPPSSTPSPPPAAPPVPVPGPPPSPPTGTTTPGG